MIQSSTLPCIRQLPSTDEIFLDAIGDIAVLAGGLIAATDATLLAMPLPNDRWGAGASLVLLDQRLSVCRERTRRACGTTFRPALQALRNAGDTLFDRLDLWGWALLDAPDLCVVTDGVGIAFSLRRPVGDDGPAWLLDLAAERDEATLVLPFSRYGIWPLLEAEMQITH